MMGTSPFTGVLVRKYSPRTIALVGAVVAGTGMALASQSTQLWHVAMGYGVISGIGFSLAYVPSIVVLAHYWEKRRSLATGIAVAGSGSGTLVMAAITDALLVHYSWQGAMFIVGMLCLVVVAACACMYVPPLPPMAGEAPPAQKESAALAFKSETPLAKHPVYVADLEHGQILGATTAGAGLPVPPGAPTIVNLPLSRGNSTEITQNPVEIEMTPHMIPRDSLNELTAVSWSEQTQASDTVAPAAASHPPLQGFALTATCGDPVRNTGGQAAAHLAVVKVPLEQPAALAGEALDRTAAVEGTVGEAPPLAPVLTHEASAATAPCVNTDVNGLKGAVAPQEPAVADAVRKPGVPEPMLQVLQRLWKIKKYRCLVLALGPTALGYLSPYTHLKAFALSPALELSGGDAALALSAVGVASIVGRVLMGRLADMNIAGIPPHIVRNWLFMLSGFGAGLSVAGLGAAYSLGGLVAAALGFGVFSGAILSIMPVITADAVGVADLPVALPIMYFVQVPGFVVGAPIAGWVKVAADSYRPAFALSGGLMLIGALALLPLAWDRSPRADDDPHAAEQDIPSPRHQAQGDLPLQSQAALKGHDSQVVLSA